MTQRAVHRVCVYCGSSMGGDPRFAETAAALGTALAEAGVGLVYGGGAVGLMGTVADAVLAGGGEVIGVIPEGLFSREVGHTGVTVLHEVGSMHERKQLMADLADAFVALPGGLGTVEELVEAMTWAQLGIHGKPIVVVDDGGYWQPLVALLDQAVAHGFLSEHNRRLVTFVEGAGEVLPAIDQYDATHDRSRLAPGER